MTATTLGIDFGTSNTAAAVNEVGRARIIALEPGKDTLPTAIFLDYASRATLVGRAAVEAMIDGRQGRFMRSLKSILGTGLAREKRQFLNRRLTLLEIIAEFLAEIRNRAEAATGATIDHVVAGRPVHFHNASAARDRQAEVDLAECYRLAGFTSVRFMLEPEAAAVAAGPGDGIGLIVDIGGGTSDFTLFQSQGQSVEILASHGVRVGGTDFDKALSLRHVMPLLGMGGELNNEQGSGRNDVPPAIFHDLAAWEKIAFVYEPKTVRDARQMARLAVKPDRMVRLVTVLEMELGHDIAFAVEATKIAANLRGQGSIDLSAVEAGLGAVLQEADLLAALGPQVVRVGLAAGDVLAMAGIGAKDVSRVIFVGGSSLIGIIERSMRATFVNASFEHSEVFTAVVDGLALSARGSDERLPPYAGSAI